MSADLPRAALLPLARELALRLAAFHTQDTGQTMDASMVDQVRRFAQDRPTPEELDQFLELLPTSQVARLTGASPAQVKELCSQMRQTVKRVRTVVPGEGQMEALAYVVGWSRKLLQSQQPAGR